MENDNTRDGVFLLGSVPNSLHFWNLLTPNIFPVKIEPGSWYGLTNPPCTKRKVHTCNIFVKSLKALDKIRRTPWSKLTSHSASIQVHDVWIHKHWSRCYVALHGTWSSIELCQGTKLEHNEGKKSITTYSEPQMLKTSKSCRNITSENSNTRDEIAFI